MKKRKKRPKTDTPPVPLLTPAMEDDWEPEVPAEKASYADDSRPCEPEVVTEYGLLAREPEPSAACDVPASDAKEEANSEKTGECEVVVEAIPEKSG
ncbi:hypothetical protein BFJ70_g7994 [Fusarium oxysporum]|nr:hypothetical protein BFJ70_g7994 [Fusarium oxysporum]